MKTDQIFKFIQTPEKLNRETLPLLKEMTERYPAFESAWILYLKNLKNLNDSSFGRELINGAIRIHDRRKLYLLLNEKSQEPAALNETQESENSEIFNLIFAPEYRLEMPVSEDQDGSENQKISVKKYQLIEKFLEAQPKMPQVKEDGSVSPMESHKQKEEENEEFVTETLASIYAQQGYYKKAIQIFEKLSLKYPEKSAYFAGHIEKIKKLMNK